MRDEFPELILERYLANDLPPLRAREVEEACARSPALEARLRALREEREAFLHERPSKAFAHGVAVRVAVQSRGEESKGGAYRLWLLGPSLAAAAMAMVFGVLVVQTGDRPPQGLGEMVGAAAEAPPPQELNPADDATDLTIESAEILAAPPEQAPPSRPRRGATGASGDPMPAAKPTLQAKKEAASSRRSGPKEEGIAPDPGGAKRYAKPEPIVPGTGSGVGMGAGVRRMAAPAEVRAAEEERSQEKESPSVDPAQASVPPAVQSKQVAPRGEPITTDDAPRAATSGASKAGGAPLPAGPPPSLFTMEGRAIPRRSTLESSQVQLRLKLERPQVVHVVTHRGGARPKVMWGGVQGKRLEAGVHQVPLTLPSGSLALYVLWHESPGALPRWPAFDTSPAKLSFPGHQVRWLLEVPAHTPPPADPGAATAE